MVPLHHQCLSDSLLSNQLAIISRDSLFVYVSSQMITEHSSEGETFVVPYTVRNYQMYDSNTDDDATHETLKCYCFVCCRLEPSGHRSCFSSCLPDILFALMFTSSFRILSRRVKHLLNMSTTTTTTTANASSISALKAAKKQLRAEIDAKLGELSGNEVARQSKQVHQQLFALTEFRQARRVGLYLSLPSEVDTIAIVEHCFAQGKAVFVPKYRPKSRLMEFVQLHSMADYEALPIEPKWKIKQPDPADDSRPEALSTGGLDVLLVPGVAFTTAGLRLGHGMGYFDRWQAQCAATADITQPVTIGLALRQQIVADVPVSELDVRIHKVIFPQDD